jgi:hypothetical protein
MHLRSGDSTPLLPPPLRVPGRVLLERPALAGWTPLLSTADSQYSLDEFDTWELRLMENSFKLTLAGQPRPLLRPTPRGLANQLLATVDWRILGGKLGRNAAIFRTPLRTVGGRIQIELTIDCQGAVVVNRCLDIHSQDRIQLLNPQGPARPQNSRHPRSLSHDSRHEAANDFSADTRNTTSFPPAPCIIEAGKPYTSSSCFQVVAIDPAQEET